MFYTQNQLIIVIIIYLSDTNSLGFEHEYMCTIKLNNIKAKCSKNVPPPNLPLRQDGMPLQLNLRYAPILERPPPLLKRPSNIK